MKNFSLILFVLFLFAGIQPSVASIAVATSTANSNSAVKQVVHKSEKESWIKTKLEQVNHILHPEHRRPDLGKLALVFGICGFIPFIGWMPAIAAIIIGSIAMHKQKEKKDKKALVGMILGIVSLTLGIIIVAAVLIALSV